MKLGLPFLLLGSLLFLNHLTARASHAAGGQITYEYIGTAARPNQYRITCLLQHGCPGIGSPTIPISCRVRPTGTASGCTTNDPRNFAATLTQTYSSVSDLYCTSVGNACGTGSSSFITYRYTGVADLPPAAWTLSVSDNARSELANVSFSGLGDLYLETTLNNQLTLADGTQQTAHNSSPQFPDQTPLAYLAGAWQLGSYNFTAFEPDGDSLVYSLAPLLEGCNQPMTYKPAGYSGVIVVSVSPPCVISTGAAPGLYSATFPIASYRGTGTCPVQVGQPFFTFNPRQGSFTFSPLVYDAQTVTNNHYAVVGKVTEYRKLGGRYYQVGSVRRDMMVVVGSGIGNQMPRNPVASGSTAPNTAGTDSLVVEAAPLTTSTASFAFSDPNSLDLLTLTYALPADPLFASLFTNPGAPGAPITVTGNGTTAPVLQVRLRPDIDVRGRTYRIPVQVADNGCPAKGVYNYVLVLRVSGSATATATHTARARAALSAYPNPFAEQVRFTLPRPQGAQAQVLVTDALGRLVARLPVPAGPGPEATLTWTPAPTLPAGVYLARPATGGPAIRLLHR